MAGMKPETPPDKLPPGMRPARLMVPIFAANTPEAVSFSLDALNAGVYGLMLQNIAWLKHYPQTPRLYRSGVIYKPEMHRQNDDGTVIEYGEDWKTIPWVIYDGYGDCEDLGAWRAAELQARGINARPDVKIRKLPNGHWRAHVRVRWPDGRIEDPSAKLGMYAYANTKGDD